MAHPPTHMSCIHYNRESVAMHFVYAFHTCVQYTSFVRGSSTPYLRVRVRDGGLMLPHARASYRRGYDPDGPVVMVPFQGSILEDFPRQPEIKRSCQWALHAPEAVRSAGKGRGATTRVALMGAPRIPGAMRAHEGRDAGSLHAGGALPETITP
ncbi:hypothetical protein EVAR_481_1 [Eumeta japonica]|uniref:Uncharacterized protein n=1 Tax=Eumeta variegata TaxID=151549 RepID=A0A4C1SBF4_EUMVA|nr:hypothetical protein EVAR_481_1 [Eumeta japonica]